MCPFSFYLSLTSPRSGELSLVADCAKKLSNFRKLFLTRLHLQEEVARRAIVFNNLAQIMQSCTNPAISQIRNRHMRHVLYAHEHQFDKTPPNRARWNTPKLVKIKLFSAQILQSRSNRAIVERYIRQTPDIGHRTDRDSHIFYLAPPCRSRTQ